MWIDNDWLVMTDKSENCCCCCYYYYYYCYYYTIGKATLLSLKINEITVAGNHVMSVQCSSVGMINDLKYVTDDNQNNVQKRTEAVHVHNVALK